ncbi:Uncharacterised protein [Mycobacterium tuberculosis]|uniref:Uncharacterized protein n=1 Tax=Mycobacterium tuberculosis TaxID=1773 RepID=A0A916LH05_MYCTX|nr:Uncharacterised protein [Mycobacterium tuberculosis]COX77306.1 Uncharacterised protein [Mycobacterium tuberculosis]CPB67815.1 Uncharacterised protein [Mycobacterium tuberculosis]
MLCGIGSTPSTVNRYTVLNSSRTAAGWLTDINPRSRP